MQTSFTSVRNILFHPFSAFKVEPSINLVLAVIVLTTFFKTMPTLHTPDWSISFAVSVFVKVGINFVLTTVFMLFLAWVYSIFTKLLFNQGSALEIFKLSVVASIPMIFGAMISLFAQAMDYNLNFSFATGNTSIPFSLIGLVLSIWSAYIVTGGLKSILQISTLKAAFLAIIVVGLPYLLFFLSTFF